jgi:hypothetical protein
MASPTNLPKARYAARTFIAYMLVLPFLFVVARSACGFEQEVKTVVSTAIIAAFAAALAWGRPFPLEWVGSLGGCLTDGDRRRRRD